jgi:acetylornithine deacetylase/succinyl-diaminopimelate desuccinylase-like protein
MNLIGLMTLVVLAAPDMRALSRDIFRELIEIDTTDDVGNTTTAAEAVSARLRAAGYPPEDVVIVTPEPRHGSIVARLRGTGARKPLLLLAHLDVVAARRDDWTVDPFRFLEKDGYYYGRGTTDIKDGAAILVANMIRWKQEGYRPDRDIIMALTAGEEGGLWDGVEWLVANRRDLIDAAYCINTDGGDFQMKAGRRRVAAVQAAEKLSMHYVLEATDSGGHGSLPRPGNPIDRVAAALTRIAAYEFPLELSPVTRAYYERMAAMETGPRAADMKALAAATPDPEAARHLKSSAYDNALVRTTCVATRFEAGHADNALPQKARANVNCRILPGHEPGEVLAILRGLVADDHVSVAEKQPPPPNPPLPPARPSPPSVLEPEVMAAMEKVVPTLWPGVAVIPTIETGATDAYYLRPAGIPTFGISGVFIDVDDVRSHGRDERVLVESFHQGVEFYDRLVKAVSSAPRVP